MCLQSPRRLCITCDTGLLNVYWLIKLFSWAREIAQWVGTLVALLELGSITNPYLVTHNCL